MDNHFNVVKFPFVLKLHERKVRLFKEDLAEEGEDLKDRFRRAKKEDIDKFEICFIFSLKIFMEIVVSALAERTYISKNK